MSQSAPEREVGVRPRNSVAVAALVLGIVGAVLSVIPAVGIVLGGGPDIAAIICGIIGSRTQLKPLGRTNLAAVGLILGVVGLGLIWLVSRLAH